MSDETVCVPGTDFLNETSGTHPSVHTEVIYARWTVHIAKGCYEDFSWGPSFLTSGTKHESRKQTSPEFTVFAYFPLSNWWIQYHLEKGYAHSVTQHTGTEPGSMWHQTENT